MCGALRYHDNKEAPRDTPPTFVADHILINSAAVRSASLPLRLLAIMGGDKKAAGTRATLLQIALCVSGQWSTMVCQALSRYQIRSRGAGRGEAREDWARPRLPQTLARCICLFVIQGPGTM